MTYRGELVKTLWVHLCQRKGEARSLPQEFQCLAPRPIGLICNAPRLGVGFGNHDVSRYADHRQIAALAARRCPLTAVAGDNVTGARSRPERNHVDAACHGPGDRLDVLYAVPERRMRALHWLCDCQIILELIEPALEIQHLSFASLHQ